MALTTRAVDQADSCLPTVELAASAGERDSACFDVTDRARSLAGFLALSARSLSTSPGPSAERYSDAFYQARDVFLSAGLEALSAQSAQLDIGWLQLGIRPRTSPAAYGELCRRLACLARQLLRDSAVDEFFFMNKPPGMRVRFKTAPPGRVGDVADVVQAHVTRWRADGLVDHVEPGVYEPESQLFGGPRSMSLVHALFTVDSLVWLDFHSRRAVEGDSVGPAWLVSLASLRSVFTGLDITGWEDIGVWDRIRIVAGRRLAVERVSLPLYSEVAGELRSAWSRGERIVDQLHPATKDIVAQYERALLVGATQWRTGYFCDPAASLGARAAAAFYVVFHWNRAGLSATEQALIANALSERMLDDGRG